MSEEPGGTTDPAAEQVRRLLAEARHTDPVPDDVVARLDAALAAEARETETETETGTTTAPSPPVDLAARRRRRRGQGLLVAAAVVLVAGVGLGPTGLAGRVLDGAGSGADSSDPAGAGAQSAPTPQGTPGPGRGDGGAAEDGEEPGQPERPGGPGASEFSSESRPDAGGPPVVRDGPPLVGDLVAALSMPRSESLRTEQRCAPEDATGDRVRVRFEGRAAELVAQPPSEDRRRVEVWACDDDADTPALSATVPAG